MYLSEKHKFVFLRIMRTGTSSTGLYLQNQFGAEGRIEHPWKHSFEVPDEYLDFFTFTIVRNPFDRLASLWLKARRPVSAKVGHAQMTRIGFARFITLLLEYQEAGDDYEANTFNPGYSLFDQSTIISHAKRQLDEILRFEDFPRCLEKLPFVTRTIDLKRFPRITRTPPREKPLKKHYTGTALLLAREYCKRDAIAFGYPCL